MTTMDRTIPPIRRLGVGDQTGRYLVVLRGIIRTTSAGTEPEWLLGASSPGLLNNHAQFHIQSCQVRLRTPGFGSPAAPVRPQDLRQLSSPEQDPYSCWRLRRWR